MPMYVQNKVNSIISPFPFLQVLMLLHFQWSGPQGFADIFTPIQLYFKMMKKLLSSQQEYGFQHFCRFSLFSEVPISVSVCLLCECAFHSIPNTETSDLHLATILKLHRWARFLTRLATRYLPVYHVQFFIRKVTCVSFCGTEGSHAFFITEDFCPN